MVKDQQMQRLDANSTWFLDSCASRHLYNDRSLFTNTRAKSTDFVTAAGQVIRTEEIGTVSIPLADGRKIELQNVGPGSGMRFESDLPRPAQRDRAHNLIK